MKSSSRRGSVRCATATILITCLAGSAPASLFVAPLLPGSSPTSAAIAQEQEKPQTRKSTSPSKARKGSSTSSKASTTPETPATPEEFPTPEEAEAAKEPGGRVVRTDAEWRRRLTSLQYYVTRQKGTERPWTGKYSRGRHKGLFACVGCDEVLFSSRHKFESGTGWPSFWQPVSEDVLESQYDYSDGTERIEVMCRRCEAHLGHVFNDGPRPTGLRFCINSAALKLQPLPAAASGNSAAKSKGTGKSKSSGVKSKSESKPVEDEDAGDTPPESGAESPQSAKSPKASSRS
jgi:peptide-methionine (R)-S-oxide reductase